MDPTSRSKSYYPSLHVSLFLEGKSGGKDYSLLIDPNDGQLKGITQEKEKIKKISKISGFSEKFQFSITQEEFRKRLISTKSHFSVQFSSNPFKSKVEVVLIEGPWVKLPSEPRLMGRMERPSVTLLNHSRRIKRQPSEPLLNEQDKKGSKQNRCNRYILTEGECGNVSYEMTIDENNHASGSVYYKEMNYDADIELDDLSVDQLVSNLASKNPPLDVTIIKTDKTFKIAFSSKKKNNHYAYYSYNSTLTLPSSPKESVADMNNNNRFSLTPRIAGSQLDLTKKNNNYPDNLILTLPSSHKESVEDTWSDESVGEESVEDPYNNNSLSESSGTHSNTSLPSLTSHKKDDAKNTGFYSPRPRKKSQTRVTAPIEVKNNDYFYSPRPGKESHTRVFYAGRQMIASTEEQTNANLPSPHPKVDPQFSNLLLRSRNALEQDEQLRNEKNYSTPLSIKKSHAMVTIPSDSKKPTSPSQETLENAVMAFLKSENIALLIKGDPSSGKSFFVKQFALSRLIYNENHLFIYVLLSRLNNPMDAVKETLSEYGIKETDDLQKMKIVWIFDAFDEINFSRQGESHKKNNLYDTYEMKKWENSKCIFTCRDGSYTDDLFVPPQIELKTITVAPLNKRDQLHIMIFLETRKRKYQLDYSDFDVLNQLDLPEMIGNPFWFKITVDILPVIVHEFKRKSENYYVPLEDIVKNPEFITRFFDLLACLSEEKSRQKVWGIKGIPNIKYGDCIIFSVLYALMKEKTADKNQNSNPDQNFEVLFKGPTKDRLYPKYSDDEEEQKQIEGYFESLFEDVPPEAYIRYLDRLKLSCLVYRDNEWCFVNQKYYEYFLSVHRNNRVDELKQFLQETIRNSKLLKIQSNNELEEASIESGLKSIENKAAISASIDRKIEVSKDQILKFSGNEKIIKAEMITSGQSQDLDLKNIFLMNGPDPRSDICFGSLEFETIANLLSSDYEITYLKPNDANSEIDAIPRITLNIIGN